TVTFDSQGGSVPDPLSQIIVYGQLYGQLPSAGRTGYTFGGWWTDEAGTEVQILSTTTISVAEDHTLYAKWTANTYTVTFDGQYGTVPDSTTMSVTYDQQYGQLPVPTRVHHSFLGWYTGENGTGTHVLDSTTVSITFDQTLYAAWELNPYIGPAGGYVFYDRGFELDGWQYLEAAPAGWSGPAEDSTYFFGYSRITWDSSNLLAGTVAAVGSGKPNTDALVAALGNAPYVQSGGNLTATNYAAKICSNYSIQVDDVVFDDWFLPSKDELDLMYQNLYLKNLGGLSINLYWSSSEQSSENTWVRLLYDGSQFGNQRSSYLKVRPIRAL
ncbi:MAG: InlB B-repeat-containing protein, partial [Sphaerochaetaceae bacterium]|nr:InlB B-repeat-containing protein [Sphaerochaetaceae bacterium]